jgi:hypothetical protein
LNAPLNGLSTQSVLKFVFIAKYIHIFSWPSLYLIEIRGVINGKASKATALPKFSATLTLSQSGGGGGRAEYAKPLALPHLYIFVIMPLEIMPYENHYLIIIV